MQNKGIYKIVNPKGNTYIGQSNDIKKRFKTYKNLNLFKNENINIGEILNNCYHKKQYSCRGYIFQFENDDKIIMTQQTQKNKLLMK